MELASKIVQHSIAHPLYALLELLLGLLAVYWILYRPLRRNDASKSQGNHSAMPSIEEQERRLANFRSEMFLENSPSTSNVMVNGREAIPELHSRNGAHVCVSTNASEKAVEMLDLTTFDYHSFSTNKVVIDVAKQAVVDYGVGSCGPRGFYGTVKPHMEVERHIADFLGAEDCCIYSLSFATISTLISCYASRGDYIVADNGVHPAVAEGCVLTRANLKYYSHNDLQHLETLLKEVVEKEAAEKKLSRRFVVTEGVFKNTGDLSRLPEILDLCEKYKFRIILDDSYGFGAIGKSGRGTHEHFDISIKRIDIYVGSLSVSLGGVGGFCAGDVPMVDFQRLAASAYVFSASLPPYITSCTSAAVSLLQKDPQYALTLQENAKLFRQHIRDGIQRVTKVMLVDSDKDASPLVVIKATEAYTREKEDLKINEELEQVVQEARENKIFICRHYYDKSDICKSMPSIFIVVKGLATREELLNASDVISKSIKRIFA